MSDRYGIKTGYHYWQIIDRNTGEAVASYSARGKGDVKAKDEARRACRILNDRIETQDACDRGEHPDVEDLKCLVCGEWVIT